MLPKCRSPSRVGPTHHAPSAVRSFPTESAIATTEWHLGSTTRTRRPPCSPSFPVRRTTNSLLLRQGRTGTSGDGSSQQPPCTPPRDDACATPPPGRSVHAGDPSPRRQQPARGLRDPGRHLHLADVRLR